MNILLFCHVMLPNILSYHIKCPTPKIPILIITHSTKFRSQRTHHLAWPRDAGVLSLRQQYAFPSSTSSPMMEKMKTSRVARNEN
jgi:hypothetical protein